jgi:hypothetical protein
MAVIRLSATAGPDGVLRLELPVGGAGEFDVVVSPKPAPAEPPGPADEPGEPLTTPEGRGWPPGYFENVIGSIDDETFVAPPRGPAKPIPPLDQE